MDTKTIMTVLAMLSSGALLDGCDHAAKGGQVSPESKADHPPPVKTEAVRAQPESKAAEPPVPAKSEGVQAQPDGQPTSPGLPTPATAEAERVRPKSKPAKSPAPAMAEAKEVPSAAPADRAGQEAADAKGEMKCGEGKCGAAPSRES
jgi:hypothetical protein